MTKKNIFFIILIVAFSHLGLFCLTIAGQNKPNIILIMADDLGYETIGANGCAQYKTPNLDKMAEEGVRFTHCYAQPLCTPSRVKIMTGKYNNRNHIKWGTLKKGEYTFAHLLKDAGYITACAGKWQLSGGSDRDGQMVHEAGFDEACMWSYGFDLENEGGFKLKHQKGSKNNYYYHQKERYYCVNDERPHMTSRYWYPAVLRNGEFYPTTYENYGPDIYSDFLINFMERNKDNPFFIYYPMALIHGPFNPTPETKGIESYSEKDKFKSSKENFGDMVEYTDKIVGKILSKITELGIEDNTIVIFTGDNGTTRGVETKMKDGSICVGGKGSTKNSGTHVPLIVKWDGHARRSFVTNELVDFTDFLVTFADIANIEIPERAGIIDGNSFLPVILGNQRRNEKKWVFCHYDKNPNSPNPKFPRARFARNQQYKLYDYSKFYNITNDPIEINPLSYEKLNNKEKKVFHELQKVLDQMEIPAGFESSKSGVKVPKSN